MSDPNISAIRAKLKFSNMRSFIADYSKFVTEGAIFIPVASHRLRSVGTTVRFQLQISSGETALFGEGVVFQVRRPRPGESQSNSGMLLKFTKLTSQSKKVIQAILKYKKSGEIDWVEEAKPARKRNTNNTRTSLSWSIQPPSSLDEDSDPNEQTNLGSKRLEAMKERENLVARGEKPAKNAVWTAQNPFTSSSSAPKPNPFNASNNNNSSITRFFDGEREHTPVTPVNRPTSLNLEVPAILKSDDLESSATIAPSAREGAETRFFPDGQPLKSGNNMRPTLLNLSAHEVNPAINQSHGAKKDLEETPPPFEVDGATSSHDTTLLAHEYEVLAHSESANAHYRKTLFVGEDIAKEPPQEQKKHPFAVSNPLPPKPKRNTSPIAASISRPPTDPSVAAVPSSTDTPEPNRGGTEATYKLGGTEENNTTQFVDFVDESVSTKEEPRQPEFSESLTESATSSTPETESQDEQEPPTLLFSGSEATKASEPRPSLNQLYKETPDEPKQASNSIAPPKSHFNRLSKKLSRGGFGGKSSVASLLKDEEREETTEKSDTSKPLSAKLQPPAKFATPKSLTPPSIAPPVAQKEEPEEDEELELELDEIVEEAPQAAEKQEDSAETPETPETSNVEAASESAEETPVEDDDEEEAELELELEDEVQPTESTGDLSVATATTPSEETDEEDEEDELELELEDAIVLDQPVEQAPIAEEVHAEPIDKQEILSEAPAESEALELGAAEEVDPEKEHFVTSLIDDLFDDFGAAPPEPTGENIAPPTVTPAPKPRPKAVEAMSSEERAAYEKHRIAGSKGGIGIFAYDDAPPHEEVDFDELFGEDSLDNIFGNFGNSDVDLGLGTPKAESIPAIEQERTQQSTIELGTDEAIQVVEAVEKANATKEEAQEIQQDVVSTDEKTEEEDELELELDDAVEPEEAVEVEKPVIPPPTSKLPSLPKLAAPSTSAPKEDSEPTEKQEESAELPGENTAEPEEELELELDDAVPAEDPVVPPPRASKLPSLPKFAAPSIAPEEEPQPTEKQEELGVEEVAQEDPEEELELDDALILDEVAEDPEEEDDDELILADPIENTDESDDELELDDVIEEGQVSQMSEFSESAIHEFNEHYEDDNLSISEYFDPSKDDDAINFDLTPDGTPLPEETQEFQSVAERNGTLGPFNMGHIGHMAQEPSAASSLSDVQDTIDDDLLQQIISDSSDSGRLHPPKRKETSDLIALNIADQVDEINNTTELHAGPPPIGDHVKPSFPPPLRHNPATSFVKSVPVAKPVELDFEIPDDGPRIFAPDEATNVHDRSILGAPPLPNIPIIAPDVSANSLKAEVTTEDSFDSLADLISTEKTEGDVHFTQAPPAAEEADLIAQAIAEVPPPPVVSEPLIDPIQLGSNKKKKGFFSKIFGDD